MHVSHAIIEKVLHQSQAQPLAHCHRLQSSVGINVIVKEARLQLNECEVDPLIVRVEAVQPEKLQFVKMAESLESIMLPAELGDEPKNCAVPTAHRLRLQANQSGSDRGYALRLLMTLSLLIKCYAS